VVRDQCEAARILLGLFALCILTVYFTDVWLVTCGFDGCPSPRAIQNFQPDQGGRISTLHNRVDGRLELVRRVNVPLSSVPNSYSSLHRD